MNISTLSLSRTPRFSGRIFGTALMALVLLVGAMPSTAHAQRFGGRGFGRGFGGGLGWGLGIGIGSAIVYDSLYYSPPVVYTTAPAPTIYYVPQPAPQTVVVNSPAPAPAPSAAPAPTVAAPTSNAGKLSRIVYDSAGKPLGVLILNADGQQEFVPLAQ